MLNVEIARDCGSKYGGSVLVTDRNKKIIRIEVIYILKENTTLKQILVTSASHAITADVIYTDVWVSMGEESEFEERINLLKDYQVNKAMFELTGKDSTIFLHCLRAVGDAHMLPGRYGRLPCV